MQITYGLKNRKLGKKSDLQFQKQFPNETLNEMPLFKRVFPFGTVLEYPISQVCFNSFWSIDAAYAILLIIPLKIYDHEHNRSKRKFS
jgi:hypothetical protein